MGLCADGTRLRRRCCQRSPIGEYNDSPLGQSRVVVEQLIPNGGTGPGWMSYEVAISREAWQPPQLETAVEYPECTVYVQLSAVRTRRHPSQGLQSGFDSRGKDKP